MKKILLITLAFLLLSAGAQARSVQVAVREHTLGNGMRVLILPKRDAPVVAAFIQFRTGSVNERPGLTGASHLLEHMMFKGTKIFGTTDYQAEAPMLREIDRLAALMEKEQAKLLTAYGKGDPGKVSALKQKIMALIEKERKYIVKDELWSTYQKNGCESLNASTGYDTTQYYVELPANRLELWALMESDRIKNAVFREFYSERDVVREERRLGIETRSEGLLWEKFMSTMFEATPYHWYVLGYASDIETMKREEVAEHFKTYYAPNNAVAVIVGDVQEDQVMALMKKYFEPIPAQRPPRPVFARDEKQCGEKRIEVEFDAKPSLTIGFHGPLFGSSDQYALEILGRILSLGRTSRFYQELIDKRPLALSADAYNMDMPYANFFVIEALPKAPHTTRELEESIYAELEKVKTEPVSQWELEKVRNQMDADFVRGLEDNMGLARMLGSAKIRTGDWRNFDEREKYAKVTPEDIMRVAGTYFTKTNRTVAELVSKEKEK
ncbi:MAG: pitrilysin family protein [bacterium]